jgi:Glycosyl hydrolase family 76
MTGFVRRLFTGGKPPVDVPDGRSISDPESRARDAWRILHDTSMMRRGGQKLLVMDGPGRQSGVAAVWPLSQVVAAALDLARLDLDGSHGGAAMVDDLAETLELYRWGDGYAPHPGGQERYFDDNAWVGLDAIQAHAQLEGRPADSPWLHKAKRTFVVVIAGQDDDGGVRWKEGPTGRPGSRNSCSTAPAIELALRLHGATGTERYRQVAERADAWLWRELASPEGLLWDHVDPDGTTERTVWSYNQGAAIGADVLWWRSTADRARLDRAIATAGAALDHFSIDDRLWQQPPAFNAIFFRNLLQLHGAEPQPRVVAELDRYLERAWREARDPVRGCFTGGGIGHYDNGGSLDHAALVQLFALQAFPIGWLPDVA